VCVNEVERTFEVERQGQRLTGGRPRSAHMSADRHRPVCGQRLSNDHSLFRRRVDVQLVVFVYADVAIATGEHLHDARQRALGDEPRQRRRRRRRRRRRMRGVGRLTVSGDRRHVGSARHVRPIPFVVHRTRVFAYNSTSQRAAIYKHERRTLSRHSNAVRTALAQKDLLCMRPQCFVRAYRDARLARKHASRTLRHIAFGAAD